MQVKLSEGILPCGGMQGWRGFMWCDGKEILMCKHFKLFLQIESWICGLELIMMFFSNIGLCCMVSSDKKIAQNHISKG